MNKEYFENNYEHIISFNEIKYHFKIELDNLKQKLIISGCDQNFNSFYEIQLTLEELFHFCKVFKSCDSIEDAHQMLNNYFKSKKAEIKEISKNYLNLCFNVEVLGKEKFIELSLNKIKKNEKNEQPAPNEIEKIKLNQKTLINKIEKLTEVINKLKKELVEEKKSNNLSNLSNELKEIENENGDKYIGSIYNNKKEGRGKMIYKNGETYIGEWLNDLKDGKGIYYYNN